MTSHELARFIKLARDLFPQATLSEVALVAETAGQMQFNRSLAVLKTHKRRHDFFSVKGLTEALHGDHQKAIAIQTARKDEKVIDWVRKQYAVHLYSDIDALREHFQLCAGKIRHEGNEDGRSEAYRVLYGHAVMALEQIGMDHADADELAKEWVGAKAVAS